MAAGTEPAGLAALFTRDAVLCVRDALAPTETPV
jgi:hypothetical protein